MALTPEEQLATHIGRLLNDGFSVDENTWRFLNSTLPDPTPEGIAALLDDAGDSEGATIAELLFFPSESMQIKLEPHIGAVPLTAQNINDLVMRLTAMELETAIHFETLRTSLSLTMPPFALERFVARLHLDYQLPVKLAASIDNCLSDTDGVLAKVRLRNNQQVFQNHQIDLLIHFFKGLSSSHSQFWPGFEFLQTILPECPPLASLFDFLMEKKKYYFQAVIRAEQFLQRLQQSNMETLILQGERAAFIHPEEGRRIMRNIDTICRAFFGRSDHFQMPQTKKIQVDGSGSQENLSKIIDYLS